MSSRWRSSSTSEEGRATNALPFALLLALAAAVAGCTAFDVFGGRPAKDAAAVPAASAKPGRPVPPPVAWTPPAPPARVAFNHQFHLGRGTECADCHEAPEPSGRMAMPDPEFCSNCHGEIDAKKPKEKTVEAFFDAGGKPAWSRVTSQGPDIVFSHKTHLDRKLECAQCHAGVAESTAVGSELFTSMDACVKCHTEMQAKNECATCHRAGAESVAKGKGSFFAPANHDAAWRSAHGAVAGLSAPRGRGERCDVCHGRPGMPESASCDTCHASTKPADHDREWRGVHGKLVRGDGAAQQACARCHENPVFPAQAQCDTCHATAKPADHDTLWTDLHGQAVRRDPTSASGRCDFCHGRNDFPSASRCTGCHMTEPPRDHTESWRAGGGHGLAAALDRGRCEACHTVDSCTTCHATVTPRSHRGNWGGPRNRHCVGCHLPLRENAPEGCGVCHKGTPSHDAAPPMPAEPPHRPDMTCRKCHTPPKNLKHADNGTNCVACHR